jgi:hypothetical protein
VMTAMTSSTHGVYTKEASVVTSHQIYFGGWDVFLISCNHDHGFSPHKGLLNGLKLHGYVLTVLNDMSLMSVQHFSSGLCFFSITILSLYHSCKTCILASSGNQYNCYYYIYYGY